MMLILLCGPPNRPRYESFPFVRLSVCPARVLNSKTKTCRKNTRNWCESWPNWCVSFQFKRYLKVKSVKNARKLTRIWPIRICLWMAGGGLGLYYAGRYGPDW